MLGIAGVEDGSPGRGGPLPSVGVPWYRPRAPDRRPLRSPLLRPPGRRPAGGAAPLDDQVRRVRDGPRRHRRLQAAELDDPADGDRGERRTDRRAQARRARPGSSRHPHRRGRLRRHARHGRGGRAEKDGVERDLQEALAAAPENCGEGFRLVRREWPTDIGPVDLMCRDVDDGWIAVEIKRVATIDAVEQLARYLERIRLDPAMGRVPRRPRGPGDQAAGAGAGRGARHRCVEVDLARARRARTGLTLFAA